VHTFNQVKKIHIKNSKMKLVLIIALCLGSTLSCEHFETCLECISNSCYFSNNLCNRYKGVSDFDGCFELEHAGKI